MRPPPKFGFDAPGFGAGEVPVVVDGPPGELGQLLHAQPAVHPAAFLEVAADGVVGEVGHPLVAFGLAHGVAAVSWAGHHSYTYTAAPSSRSPMRHPHHVHWCRAHRS